MKKFLAIMAICALIGTCSYRCSHKDTPTTNGNTANASEIAMLRKELASLRQSGGTAPSAINPPVAVAPVPVFNPPAAVAPAPMVNQPPRNTPVAPAIPSRKATMVAEANRLIGVAKAIKANVRDEEIKWGPTDYTVRCGWAKYETAMKVAAEAVREAEATP